MNEWNLEHYFKENVCSILNNKSPVKLSPEQCYNCTGTIPSLLFPLDYFQNLAQFWVLSKTLNEIQMLRFYL